MANNRLMIACTACREAQFLGKAYGTSFDIYVSVETIDTFFLHHAWCSQDGSHLRLAYEDGTESLGKFAVEVKPCPSEWELFANGNPMGI